MTKKYFFLRLVPCEEDGDSFDSETNEELIDIFISKWSDMLKIEDFKLEKIFFEEVI